MSLIEKAIQKQLNDDTDSRQSDSENSSNQKDVSYLVDSVYSDWEREQRMAVGLVKSSVGGVGLSKDDSLSPQSSVTLDFKRLEGLGFITPEMTNRRIAEELRIIKRRILINVAGLGERVAENSNLIMVTSSAPGEGKTFMSINLAMSIAMEIDRTVLLVDADVTKSDVSRTLGIPKSKGLTDLIADPSLKLSDVLVKTDVEHLTILPAGTRMPNVNEQMASSRMARILKDLARKYKDRIIIFDSPPLLATSEASILARLMGQVIVVVEAEGTKQSELLTALDMLDPSMNIGLVLNKTSEKAETDYYEYYQSLQ